MTRFDVIEKHYKFIQKISRSFTKDWHDFSHDLVEYLIYIKEDIISLDQRNEFEPFLRVVAYRRWCRIKKQPYEDLREIAQEEEEFPELREGHPDDVEKLSKLSRQDRIILSIFAQGPTLREASRRTLIDRATLKKMLNQARKNAQEALK